MKPSFEAPEARPPLVYFASADGGIEHSINQKQFDQSLVYNLLFEPAGLVVPDIFFYNCRFLINHIEHTGRSLFESALSNGLVIPAFRSAETETFRGALEEIGTQAVLGIEKGQYRTTPERLASRLDQSYRLARGSLTRIVWPDNMGGAFAVLVSDVLRQESPQVQSEVLARLWADSEPWRIGCLSEAERLTSMGGGSGIRRAEIWNAVGRQLGVLGRDRTFDKPRDLVFAVPAGSNLSRQVQFFVDVVNICYERSQAVKFGAIHNIPSVLSRHAEPVIPALGVLVSARSGGYFSMTVRLPTATTLLRSDSSELIAVRKSDPGAGYFERRRAWAENPSSETEEELRHSIREYADHLIEIARGAQKRTVLAFMSERGRKALDATVGAGVALGSERIGIPAEFSLMGGIGASVVTDIVTSALHVLEEGPHVPKARHEVTIKSSTELNVPT